MSEVKIALGKPEKLTGEIIAGFKMAQEFEALKPILKSVEINFATYQRLNSCSINVSIKDMDGITLGYNHLNGRTITDNAFKSILINVKLEPGKRYLLVLAGVDGMQGHCPTAKLGTSDGKFVFLIGQYKVDGMNLYCNIIFDDVIDQIKTPPMATNVPKVPCPTLEDVIKGKVAPQDYQPEPEATEKPAIEQYFEKTKKK